jgi:hypothetical protein
MLLFRWIKSLWHPLPRPLQELAETHKAILNAQSRANREKAAADKKIADHELAELKAELAITWHREAIRMCWEQLDITANSRTSLIKNLREDEEKIIRQLRTPPADTETRIQQAEALLMETEQ